MEYYRELPKGCLDRFRQQIGKRYENIWQVRFANDDRIIIIGDYTNMAYLESMNENPSLPEPILSIYDGETKREDYHNFEYYVLNHDISYIQVQNPARQITWLADDIVNYALENKVPCIKVDGEEDLLTISAIRHADIGDFVMFGVPDVGVEVVQVDWHIKELIEDIYDSMKKCGFVEKHVAVAGTFATIHEGHRELLDMAFSLGRRVEIGLTSDEFMRRTRVGELPDYMTREKNLVDYIESKGYTNYDIWMLHQNNVYLQDVSTLVCSEETLQGAYELNSFNGGKLEIVSVPIVKDENGRKISSSTILGYEKVKQ